MYICAISFYIPSLISYIIHSPKGIMDLYTSCFYWGLCPESSGTSGKGGCRDVMSGKKKGNKKMPILRQEIIKICIDKKGVAVCPQIASPVSTINRNAVYLIETNYV